MRKNQFQDSRRGKKEKSDGLIENFTNRLWQRSVPSTGREGRPFENATMPQLFASNEPSRDIFQPVRLFPLWKKLPRRCRDRRRRMRKGERGRGQDRDRDTRPYQRNSLSRNGVTRETTTCSDEMTRYATLFREKRTFTTRAENPCPTVISQRVVHKFTSACEILSIMYTFLCPCRRCSTSEYFRRSRVRGSQHNGLNNVTDCVISSFT